ncbi:hypothetical protein COCNU_13G006730 [Cocos nucifera]|uniref:Uncharacterized protein n=1 Tax=Cocos nucifera TaxID=13894 RepID=A0A8K0ITV6_COCNU|nr:hypothetical protein COCNU_13G006730 [Cocos nucifera]
MSLITMASKRHLDFIPVPWWVTRSLASEEQSEHTPSTSASTAQEPPPLASTPSVTSTPPITEPLSSSISKTHATTQTFECASSSWIFRSPTHMTHVWNCQHQRSYDFPNHERARDARLRKIRELYGVTRSSSIENGSSTDETLQRTLFSGYRNILRVSGRGWLGTGGARSLR